MATIDDRVVNMQFNNAQFQKDIGNTNDSLQELKKNLNLNGATDGLDAVQGAANRFSLQNIESALDNIKSKFGVFGAVGFTIIQDLTNAALNAGKSMASALIDPILQGGEARAEALQKAQFQFRGLGLDVTATMNAAKASVLGTAFSLDQAATAAGQLGASGISAGHGLEGALRGIAGVAAQTGSSFDSIAQIFEKVSGNGRLMGEDLLQLSSNGVNAAAVLAKSMGTTEAKVREMVTAGKISFAEFSDAMGNTFGDNAKKANELFSGAVSNMRAALSRLGADFEGPKLLNLRDIFNALSPLIDNVHAALLPLINDFNNIQNSGAATVVLAISRLLGPGIVASIQNVVRAIETIGKALSGGFRQIFPDNTAAQLTAISVFLQKITEAMIPGTKAAAELQRTFAGVFAVFDIVGQIVSTIVKTFFDLIGVAAPVSGGFLEITAKIGDFLVKVDQFLKRGQYIQNFFRTIGGVIAVPVKILQTFFGVIADGIKDLGLFNGAGKPLDDFADDLQKRFSGLTELGRFFNTVWNGVVAVATAVWNFLRPIFVAIGNFVSDAVTNIRNSLMQLKFTDVLQAINTGIFGAGTGGFLFLLRGFFGNIGGALQGNGVAFVSAFKRVFGQLQLNLKALQLSTNAKTLETIAIAVALLAASAVALSLVDSAKLGLAMSAIVTSMGALLGSMALLNKVGGAKGIAESFALSLVLTGLATALLILAGAIAILGALPLPNLIQGTTALVVVLAALTGTLALMGKIGPSVLASAGAIAIFAPAMAILAGTIAILGAIPFSNLVQGMGAFIVLMASLVGALALLSKVGPQVLLSAVSIAIIAPALAVLTGAVAALGALPFDNLLRGMGALVVMLAAVTGAILLLGLAGPEVLLGAIAIGAVALSLVPLIGAIALLGTIPLDKLISGLVAFTVALAILVGAVLLLGFTGPVALIGAAAIVAIALAIAVLAPALKLLSTIPWDGIGKVLTILSAGLGILVVMGILLIPASVGFLLLGTAILLIGVGVGLAADGIGKLALGIAALVGIGAGAFALMGVGIDTLVGKLPELGAGIGAALVSMAVVIGQNAPQLIQAFVQLLLAMLSAVDQVVPQIIVVATDIIVALVNALVILVPLLVDAGLTIINGVLQGISDHIARTTELGVLIISHFIDGISAGLPTLIQSGVNLVISFMNGIANAIRNNRQQFVNAALNIADAITGGLSTGLLNGVGKVVSAVRSLISHIPQAIKDILGIRSPSRVVAALMAFVGDGASIGLESKTAQVTASASKVGNAAITGLKDSLAGLDDALNDNMDMTPTIRPVLDLSDVQNKAHQVSSLLQPPTLSLGTTNDVASSVSLQEQARNAQLVLSTEGTPQNDKGDIYYTQNNNSPKALSPTEIYRQTRNQLATLKGDLGVVDQSGSS